MPRKTHCCQCAINHLVAVQFCMYVIVVVSGWCATNFILSAFLTSRNKQFARFPFYFLFDPWKKQNQETRQSFNKSGSQSINQSINQLFILLSIHRTIIHLYFFIIVFSCERRDLLCSHSNGDIFTCENNMFSSGVKICFRAKAHLVFHWCLYNEDNKLPHWLVRLITRWVTSREFILYIDCYSSFSSPALFLHAYSKTTLWHYFSRRMGWNINVRVPKQTQRVSHK